MNRKFFWGVVVILLVAFALRVYRLDAQSLWWDEIMVALIGRLPFPQWFEPLLLDRAQPPGYYFWMWLWSPLGGSEFLLRFPSVVEGVLTVAIVARLGARVGGARAGLTAALLMALSPFFIWYAQELRMYARLVLLCAASSWAFLELSRRPRRNIALALFGIAALGLYTHYLFGFYLVAQLLYLVMSRGRYPRALRYWLAATGGAGLLFVPWVIALVVTPLQGRPNLDWIPNPQWFDPILSFFGAEMGASADPNTASNWVAPLCAFALAVVGVVAFWKVKREEVRWLLTWLLAPWLFLFLVSLFVPGRALYADRYLTPFVPALLLLSALGVSALYERQRVLALAAVAVIVVAMLVSLASMYTQPRYARDDFRGVATELAQNADSAQDAVLLDLSLMLPFDLYKPDAFRRIERPFSDAESVPEWVNNPGNFEGAARVWLLTTALPINVHRFYADEAGQTAYAKQDAFKLAMDSRYKVLAEKWFPGLMLTEYQVKP